MRYETGKQDSALEYLKCRIPVEKEKKEKEIALIRHRNGTRMPGATNLEIPPAQPGRPGAHNDET